MPLNETNLNQKMEVRNPLEISEDVADLEDGI